MPDIDGPVVVVGAGIWSGRRIPPVAGRATDCGVGTGSPVAGGGADGLYRAERLPC